MQVVSEGPVKITRARIDAAWKRRAPGVRIVVRDLDCRGLALTVNATGMSWSYSYRPRGVDAGTGRRFGNQSVTIGNPATHDPDAARRAAEGIKGQAAAGRDPAAEKRASAEVERRRRAKTVGRLLDIYAVGLPTRPKLRGTGLPSPAHVKDELAFTRAAVAVIGAEAKPIAELTVADVKQVVSADGARPATARARFGALNRFLDWCIDAGHIDINVCLLLPRARRPRAVQSRAHFLTLPDLARLWRAADGLPHAAWRDYARFLIAVPCRRGEAADLDWADLDLDGAEWLQAAGTTKNGEPHRLHLHPLALDVLRARHRDAGKPAVGIVFPSPEAGTALTTFSALKRALDGKAKLTAAWRWHDLRRSFATLMGEQGIAEPVVDAVLNHKAAATRGGVLGVYQRSSRQPEQVAAMRAWGTALAGALAPHSAPQAGGKVVRLRRAAG